MNNYSIKIKRFMAIITVLLVVDVQIIYSQTINSKTEISWEKGEILISATTEIPDDDANLTAVRLKLSEYVDRQLTDVVLKSFYDINFDSLYSLSEAFTMNMGILSDFDSMNMKKSKISCNMSKELDSLTNFYRYNIANEIIPLLITHKNSKLIPIELNYTSTAKFSGIVIYAGDELPFHGENNRGNLQPAILPKIYSEKMSIVVSAEMVDPVFLTKWGMLQYSTFFDERKYEDRIGVYPLRATAEAIFGNKKTDIIISEETAAKILFLEENHKLIKEGRILVILPKK